MGVVSRIAIAAALVALVLAGAYPSTAQTKQAATGSNPPAAKVGEEVISLEEVERGVRPQLAKLEEQRYALLDDKLDQLIGERLLAQESKKLGISTEQLLRNEVYAKAPEVTDADVAAFINQNRARLPQGDEAELKLKVWDYLRAQKVNERRRAYIESLRKQNAVTVYLQAPASARVAVNGNVGFVRGSKDAPVTIVEFSDFQCPFCKNATATVKQVVDKYEGKVKLVFRDFPIATLHPLAPKAHEAARCAADQGKFWEYHDILFDRSPRQSPDDLKKYADELKLDQTAFAQCLDSGKQQESIGRDIQEGTSLGVTGTPTFFINGRELVGAQPLTAFQKIIDSELASTARK